MLYQLEQNQDRDEWDDDENRLFRRLALAVEELEDALAHHRRMASGMGSAYSPHPSTAKQVLKEAANVANYAMMLANSVLLDVYDLDAG